MKHTKIVSLFTFSLLFPCLMIASCNKINLTNIPTSSVKTVQKLPEREVKVYIGIADRWHDIDDSANYSKWSYVRENAAGFYTNFIQMWQNSYQNSQDPQKSCDNMRKAFLKNGCFFETSMETQVNDSPDGINNESTDKKYIDLLINAGFSVDETSLNYGVDVQRIKTLRTYDGTRSCLTLVGPWTVGGNILSDGTIGNKQIRDNIIITDGMETDGPLGFWYNDSGEMREGSYSLVNFVENQNKTSAVMLAPYDAGVEGYNQTRDYLTISKQCVLEHEDNNASPDIWTIWTYGELSDEPTFPESFVDSLGETEPANTLMGVGYWLIKHLNSFPKLGITIGNVNNNVAVKATNDSTTEVSISKGSNGAFEYNMPILLSNDGDPQIEISPVIYATVDGGSKDWNISFNIAGKDLTDEIVYNGGLNCINNFRISKTNKLSLILNIKSKSSNISMLSPVSIKIETMSNISNTRNNKSYTVGIKAS
jgi:hypothetical protein